MRRDIRLSLLALLPVLACAAGGEREPAAPKAYSQKLAHAPRPLPDRIVLTWSGDPATTQAVTWRTDTSVRAGVAELALANEDGRSLQPQQHWAKTSGSFTSDLNKANYHSVEFTGLQPDTLYTYRVGDGTNWSEWFHFRTAARGARPFTFVYFGDAQNDIRTHWSRVFREAFRDAPRAAFTLHAGDLINDDDSDAQWGEWHGAPGWVNATIPVVAAPGNHEYFRADPRTGKPLAERTQENPGIPTVSRHWRPQFSFPVQHQIQGIEETCYYFDYQGARIIVLDSNRDREAQAQWLRGVLRDNPQRWTILTFHHPVFSPARDRDNPELRALWKPIFDEFKVDLVLTGHDHTYARVGLRTITAENVPAGYSQAYDPAIGTMYVVSVSGPKMYNITHDAFVRTAEDTQLYQVIRVESSELRFEARTATGRLYDAFTLRKREGQPNELIEALPPERRRPPPQPEDGQPSPGSVSPPSASR